MNVSPKKLDKDELERKVRELAPWHMGIQITNEVNTADFVDSVSQVTNPATGQVRDPLQRKENFLNKVRDLFPGGVADKSFLDCACNAGGYCFWMAELGASSAFGFDAREHWIDQANFILKHKDVGQTDNVEFAVCDLYDVPKLNLEPFDLTLFKGIFYHLPDVVHGLKVAVELSRDVMIVNTCSAWGEKDGYLKFSIENPELPTSGIHGLNWYPTGPEVLAGIMKYLGMPECKLMFHRQMPDVPHLGRLEIVAARDQGRLDNFRGEYL